MRARARLRLAGALVSGAATVTLVGVLCLPDPDPSDHGGLVVLAGVCALVSVVLLLWRRPPAAVLALICPLGIVLVAAATAIAEPVGFMPTFLLWPLALCAYFFGRRVLLANALFAAALMTVTLILFVEPGLRGGMFVAVLGIAGVGAGVVAALREEIEVLVHRLHVLASSDPLTGALSRLAFDDRVAAELARSRRSGLPCAMAIIDVDHFKALNDRFGHAAGDEALRALARVVDDERRATDVFGRLGGDEFAILVLDSGITGAVRLVERVRERMALLASLNGWPATLSVGISGGAPTTGDDLLRRADRALYAAKRGGRNRTVCGDVPATAPEPGEPLELPATSGWGEPKLAPEPTGS